VLKIKI
jgi:hypothetical protein